MNSQISEGALQLYEYMKANYKVRQGDKEFEAFGVFPYDGVFEHTYEVYLCELLDAKAIRLQNNCAILCRARLQPFVDLAKSEESMDELTGRYEANQQLVLAQLFRSFSLIRPSGKFSGKAIYKELKYYSNFSIPTVMTSAERYLKGGRQLGPSYFRGILRGVDKEGSTTPSVSSSAVEVSPNSQHSEEKNKAEWVRQRIDQVEFSAMAAPEQDQYLQKLDQEYRDGVANN